jgi:hypothetical protein
MPSSLHAIKAFCSLSISALMIATSLGESMDEPPFLVICAVLAAVELYPTEVLDKQVGRQVNYVDMVSKTEQHSPLNFRDTHCRFSQRRGLC